MFRHREVMMVVRQGQREYAVISGVMVPFVIHVLCFYLVAKDVPVLQIFVFIVFYRYLCAVDEKMSYKNFIFYLQRMQNT